MSRIGKRPVTVPSGVTATVEGQTVKMKGPKGQLQFIVHDDVEVKFENGEVKVAPRVKTNRAQAMYGTARAQVANLVEASPRVSRRSSRSPASAIARHAGQEPAARARLQPRRRLRDPGRHAITVPKPTEIIIAGNDSQRVGQVAAEIRSYRPPEPYKARREVFQRIYLPQGRQEEVTEPPCRDSRSRTTGARSACGCRCAVPPAAATAVGVPLVEAHLRQVIDDLKGETLASGFFAREGDARDRQHPVPHRRGQGVGKLLANAP